MNVDKAHKYHYNLYLLYKAFGEEPFFVKQGEEAISMTCHPGYHVTRAPLYTLREKGLLEQHIERKFYIEEAGNRNYHIISEKGMLVINRLINNHLITKYLLGR